jgi:hypothetical protein
MSNADTYLHKRLDHCTTETRVPLNLQYFPLQTGTVQRLAMASRLLNFQVWDESANIAARHSSIRPIGSKAKTPALSSWTSSFVTVVTCKRENSDCLPRKSVFGMDLPQKPQQPKKRGRHCGDGQQSEGVEASKRKKGM